MQNYKDLVVWQKAMELVEQVYGLVKELPREEMYALSDQMRRAAISIPSNIAEGYGRGAPKDYVRFLSIARGSKYELETQLLVCVRLGFLSQSQITPLLQNSDEIGRMLNVMIGKIGIRN